MWKLYFIQQKIFGQLCFSGQALVAQKSWMIEKACSIQCKISGHPLFFRASACTLLKTPECKKYIPYSKKLQDTLCFSRQAQVTQKFWMQKVLSTQRKIYEQLCFPGQAQVAQNSWMYNVYSIQWKIPRQLCFLGQEQVTQNSWIIKNIYLVQWIQGTPCFLGQAQVAQKFRM